MGGGAFYSYIASPLAFKYLERPQFGLLQNKVFPIYFSLQSVIPLILLATAPQTLTTPQISYLIAASVLGLANKFYFLPTATRIKTATFAKGHELGADFKKIHGLSMLSNTLHIVSLAAYGVALSAAFV